MLESVWPVFFSKGFIVCGLIFRSLIQFEFIFVYGSRALSRISWLSWLPLLVSHPAVHLAVIAQRLLFCF